MVSSFIAMAFITSVLESWISNYCTSIWMWNCTI